MSATVRSTSGSYSPRVQRIELPRFRASFTVYVDNAAGGAWTVGVECVHMHTTHADAQSCARRLARFIDRHEALPAYAVETWPGSLAHALAHRPASSA